MNNLKIIDSHANIGKDYWREKIRRYPSKLSYKGLLKIMEKNGIEKSIILPCPTGKFNVCSNPTCHKTNSFMVLSHKDKKSYTLKCLVCGSENHINYEPFKYKNKAVLNAYKKNKDKFYPFIAIDYRYPLATKVLKKLLRDNEIYGIKFYAVTLFPDTPEILMNTEIMDIVSENNLCVMFHSGVEKESNPMSILKLTKKYKRNNFIVAHCARLHKSFLRCAKEMKNIFIETSLANMFSDEKLNYYKGSLTTEENEKIKEINGLYKFLVEQIGADKILFGTDIPAVGVKEYEAQIKSFRNLDLDKETIIKIGYNNVEKLLRRFN